MGTFMGMARFEGEVGSAMRVDSGAGGGEPKEWGHHPGNPGILG